MEALSTPVICEIIFCTRMNRVLASVVGDKTYNLKLPKTIRKNQLSEHKIELLKFIMFVGMNNGSLVVYTEENGKEEIFGLKAKPNEWEWDALSTQRMKMCLNSGSSRVGLPKKVRITTFDKYYDLYYDKIYQQYYKRA